MNGQVFPGPITSLTASKGRGDGKPSGRRRVTAGLSAGCLAAAVLIISAPPAQAATTVRVIGDNLEVQMASGVPHNTTISLVTIPLRGDFYQVRDTAGDTLTAGSRCFNVNSQTVRCAKAPILSLRATGGAKNDRIVVDAAFRGFVSINGGLDHDQILGSPGGDTIFGGAGNDVLDGRNGNDFIRGNEGNDLLLSGPGQDSLYGDIGRDVWLAEVRSDARADGFSGGADVDGVSYQLRTQPVTVTLNGRPDDGAVGEGDNVLTDVENITGGEANDVLTGHSTANGIHGGAGNDTIYGLAGNDALEGGTGSDTITGGIGADTIRGGAGNDTLLSRDLVWGNDRLNGWTGTDSCRADLFDAKTSCER